MSKQTTIKGPINGEAFEFAQGIMNDLEGKRWVKDAIRAGLAHDPGEALDGARLIFECMKRRCELAESTD